MAAAKDLDTLINRLALGSQEIQARRDFLQWSEADAERLQAHAPRMQEAHAAFVERLYEHLGAFAPTAGILCDPERLARLKRSQNSYYHKLWEGPYDLAYVRERLAIGVVHERVGIELPWYLGAYRMYLSDMLETLVESSPERATYASLLKAVFFDMALAIDTYSAAQRQALEHSEARFRRALRGANDGIWEWDVEHDRLYCSDRWAGMLGLTRDELSGNSGAWFSRVHPDDFRELRQAIDRHLRGETPWLNHEYRIRRRAGDYAWVLVRGVAERDDDGGLRLAGSQTDISHKVAADIQLRHAARHDPLTGLANRTRLDELLQQALARLRKAGARQSALLFVDLDRFKLINDSMGHAAGDLVLVEVAERLSRCLRPGDHLVRFGGDEFVALLDDMARQSDAEQVALRMLEALQQPLHLREHTLVVTASIGIATLEDHGHSLDVLQAADLALYRAKAAGKAQFARYSDELQLAAQRQLALESALARAQSQGEFELYYQPICRIEEGRPYLQAVEALLRWRHEGRVISPAEFIPALEESGEIVRVGDWVLRQACRQTRAWQLAGQTQLCCSVNISSRQLQQADFVTQLTDALMESGLPPTSLTLEITESLLMEDSAENLSILRELSSLGVRLALDDFGTGYCSLGYLKRFPLDTIKVDKSFIDGVPDHPELTAIARAIIGLGKSLHLQVVAEGVETERQLNFLQQEGCPLAQGYWFSRPRPATQLERLFDGSDPYEGQWCLLQETAQRSRTTRP